MLKLKSMSQSANPKIKLSAKIKMKMKAMVLKKINKLITPLSVMTKTPGHLKLKFLAVIHQPGHLPLLQSVGTPQLGDPLATQSLVMMRLLGAHQKTELLILFSAVILLLGHQFPLMLNPMLNPMKSLMKNLMKNLMRNLQKMMKKKEMMSQEKMMKLNDL